MTDTAARDRLATLIHDATPVEQDGGVPDVCNRYPEHEAMVDRLLAAGVRIGEPEPVTRRPSERCGCSCRCHGEESLSDWPGPCAGCCEPGDNCDCGRALTRLLPDGGLDVERLARALSEALAWLDAVTWHSAFGKDKASNRDLAVFQLTIRHVKRTLAALAETPGEPE